MSPQFDTAAIAATVLPLFQHHGWDYGSGKMTARQLQETLDRLIQKLEADSSIQWVATGRFLVSRDEMEDETSWRISLILDEDTLLPEPEEEPSEFSLEAFSEAVAEVTRRRLQVMHEWVPLIGGYQVFIHHPESGTYPNRTFGSGVAPTYHEAFLRAWWDYLVTETVKAS